MHGNFEESRRGAPRNPLDCPVEVLHPQYALGVTQNESASGLRVRVPRGLEVGERVSLVVHRGRTRVRRVGQVMWSRQTLGGYAVGISLDETTPASA